MSRVHQGLSLLPPHKSLGMGNVHVYVSFFTALHRSTNEMHTFVWQLLQVVASEERLDLRRHLKRAVEFWSRQGKLTPALVKAVCSHTESKDHLQVKCL